ncbi:MAG: flavin reductase family protein [Negativicutes bacterium]|nr:flavin reductase family protein [Negativicutes bacterium]
MSREISCNEYAGKVLDMIEKGAFLTTATDNKTNTMTIGWGSVGVIWGKPIFTVLVRQSRFTRDLIEESGEFTVSIPFGDMREALNFCGSKSGRDFNKFNAAGLVLEPGKKVATPVIAGCNLHYECKIVYKQPMIPTALDRGYQNRCYKKGDYHTMYFGEIIAAYVTE